MASRILSIALIVALFSSCSSAHKATKTPDDVYYSPGKQGTVSEENEDYVTSNSDDRYLRMKVQNHSLWSTIDDYDYWNDSRYDFGFSCAPSRFALMNCFNPYYTYYYNPFNSYMFYYTPWGGWYNPHYTIVYHSDPKVYYGTTRKTNLMAFANRNYKNYNLQPPQSKSSFGSLFQKVIAPNSTNSRNWSSTNSRTFSSGVTPGNSAGGRSGGFRSSGSSSGGIRAPRAPH